MNRTKATVALLLSFGAGYVDIVGFIGLAQTFTAHMSGNTVHFAYGIVQQNWRTVEIVAMVLLSFVIGSVVGRTVIEAGSRHAFRRVASITLLLEAVLIAAVMIAAWSGYAAALQVLLLAALAGAMGIQTATLTRIGPLTVHTTFVTGMINKLAQLVSHALFLTYDTNVNGRPLRAERDRTLKEALYISSIWIIYFIGAVAGALAANRVGLMSLSAPLVLLVIAIVVDQLHPLSLQEEHDQP